MNLLAVTVMALFAVSITAVIYGVQTQSPRAVVLGVLVCLFCIGL